MTINDQILSRALDAPRCVQTLGFELLSYCPKEMKICTTFIGVEAFFNPAGHIQGGFLCVMLDDLLGPALVFSLEIGKFSPTI